MKKHIAMLTGLALLLSPAGMLPLPLQYLPDLLLC